MDEGAERWYRDSSSNSPPPEAIYKTKGLFGLSLFRPQSEESWARAQGRSLEAGVGGTLPAAWLTRSLTGSCSSIPPTVDWGLLCQLSQIGESDLGTSSVETLLSVDSRLGQVEN